MLDVLRIGGCLHEEVSHGFVQSELDPRSVMFKMQGGKRLHALDARSSVGLEHGDRLMAYHCKDFVLDPTNRANSVGADLSKMLFNSHLSDVILEVRNLLW